MTETKDLIERPEFLAPSVESSSHEMVGMESMADHQQLAYGKMIQAMAAPELKELYAEGDFIVVPQMMKIISRDEMFHFTPVFSYLEYTIQNPLGVKPFILEKTNDKNHEIAKRARSRDPEIRFEECPESPDKRRSYVEHLNYVIVLDDHNDELGDTPLVLSFFKGEWKRGMSFNTLMRGRKKHCKNICGCRFQATISLRRNQDGNAWYGLDIVNPEDGKPWVDDSERFDSLESLQKSIADGYKSAGIDVGYGELGDAIDAEPVNEKY